MKTISDKLALYFRQTKKHQLIHQATSPNAISDSHEIAGYLNLIHPFLVNIVGENELKYLKTLSWQEQLNLAEKLSDQQTLYLIFENRNNIPDSFFQQSKIHLIISENPGNFLPQTLTNEINEFIAKRTVLHGAFVVVFGQGLLITGDSGAGKSTLLSKLVKQGHLWVADDSPYFFLDSHNQVIGHAGKTLSEFIHIKGLGPINMDKTVGQACRIRSHPLAAVMHLSNNRDEEKKYVSAYTQKDTLQILNKSFPMRHFSTTHANLELLAENYAKSLILNDWNYDSADGLENALQNALSKTMDTS